MNVDPATGEAVLTPQESWAALRARAEAFRISDPQTPEAIDLELRQIEAIGFEVADFYKIVLDEQYDAQKLHSALKNKAIAKHSATTRSVTHVRALAEVDAADALGDWLNKKAIVKHVEATLQALRTKHIGLQATKRGIESMLSRSYGRTT